MLPHPIVGDDKSRSRWKSIGAETCGKAPGSLGQAKKRRKSAGPLLSSKKKVMRDIQPRSQRPSGLPDRPGASEEVSPRQTARNDATAPGRGRSAPDVEVDRLPPCWEKGLKKRTNIKDRTASPWKETKGVDVFTELTARTISKYSSLIVRPAGASRRPWLLSRL